MMRAILLAGLLAVVGAFSLRPRPPAVPHQLPSEACAPWMAEAMTGVGVRTRDRIAAQVRAGEWERLPKAARGEAVAWFIPPPR